MDFWGTFSHFGAIFILCLLLRYCQVFRSLTGILKKQEMSGEILKKQEFLLLQEELHP